MRRFVRSPIASAEESGFTLVEVMIVSLVCLPILLGILSTTRQVADTVTVTDQSSQNTESLSGIVERIAKQIRAGKRSSFETMAIQNDVDEMRATTVGEWIPVVELKTRESLRFVSAAGTMSMNASASTAISEYALVLEAGESDNGADDDGDGLIDESTLILRRGSVPLTIARGVESFSYQVEGRAVTLDVRLARRDSKGRIYRSSTNQVLYIRNP